MSLRALAVILIALMIGPVADAGFRPQTPAETVNVLSIRFEEVLRARELSPREAASAEQAASGWFYMGPCKGTRMRVGTSGSLATTVSLAKPSRPTDAAILELIAVLVTTADPMGREPLTEACAFAEKKAAPLLEGSTRR